MAIDTSSAHLLGGSTVKRIDGSVDLGNGEVTVTAFRDPTGLVPIPDLEGTPAMLAARVRLATALAGGHLRRVEELSRATMEMLIFVMDKVLDPATGQAITGPDGEPLLSQAMVDAFRQLEKVVGGS